MNNPNILQLKEFMIFFIFGIILGVCYGVINIPKIFKKQLYLQIISDIFFAILFTISYIFIAIKINSLNVRFFLIFAYCLGFVIERITLGKLFAKFYKFMYNVLKVAINKFTNSKIGEIIFK